MQTHWPKEQSSFPKVKKKKIKALLSAWGFLFTYPVMRWPSSMDMAILRQGQGWIGPIMQILQDMNNYKHEKKNPLISGTFVPQP